MALPGRVKIVEVGPRDGLQNEHCQISSPTKIEFINLLSETGLSHIEVTSFVSPKKIPQFEDSLTVFTQINKKPGVHYSALVPNMKGLEQALVADVKEVAIFVSASETFSQRNINCSLDESINRYQMVIEKAKDNAVKVRGYISCVLGCPYEGKIRAHEVAQIAKQLFKMGCYEISLGDTIGVGTPILAKRLIDEVQQYVPIEALAVHFHDTYGQAIANIYAVLQEGIAIIDASVSGLGGCPYAKGATGNVATEDVVYLLQGMNIQTDIDLIKLSHAGMFICNRLNKLTQSKVARAVTAKHSPKV